MNWLKTTCIETAILLAAGVALGFGMNAIRGRDSIDLNRDYKPEIRITHTTTTQSTANGEAISAANPAEPNEPTEAGVAEDEPRFQSVDLEQVKEIWEDPKFGYGVYVFVDARADGPYESGHIPGAVQCDFYRIQEDIDLVVSKTAGAEKVVVYCQGGDCEDSLLTCGELINVGVPWENIYLFKAGWDAWEDSELPVETGEEE